MDEGRSNEYRGKEAASAIAIPLSCDLEVLLLRLSRIHRLHVVLLALLTKRISPLLRTLRAEVMRRDIIVDALTAK